jgi:uncharacterized protein (TIGR00251 family)
MARLRVQDGRLIFHLRLTPKGGRDAVEGWIAGAGGNEYLKARVAAPPEDGKANTALTSLLAELLDVPRSAVQIVAGETARLKTIAIRSTSQAIAARLESLGDTT